MYGSLCYQCVNVCDWVNVSCACESTLSGHFEQKSAYKSKSIHDLQLCVSAVGESRQRVTFWDSAIREWQFVSVYEEVLL